MAIYHAHIKSFSRGKGESAVAAAAYRAGIDLTDTKTQTVHRYSQRKGVATFHMLAPKGTPSWCSDARIFWDANDAWETRANARVARELEVSLPHELTDAQRERLAVALGQELVARFKVVVLVAIHEPSERGDQRNHHVHLLMSARQIGPEGFGERAGAEFDARGGRGAGAVKEVREWVGRLVNEHLAAAGVQAQVDHRSLKDQARAAAAAGDMRKAAELSRQPTRHVGKVATARVRDAIVARRAFGALVRQADPFEHAIAQAAREGRLVSTPSRHDHAAALRDRALSSRSGLESSTPHRMRGIGADLRRPAAGKAGSAPSGGTRSHASPVALRLSKIMRLARTRGDDAEILNAEKELLEGWLATQQETAQVALDSLTAMGKVQLEPEFTDAIASLRCRRVDVYWNRDFLFEDTEVLAQAVSSYASAMRSQHDARERVRNARAKLSEAEGERGTERSERRIAGAKRALWGARTAISARARSYDDRRIREARAAMVGARAHLEDKFHITVVGGINDSLELNVPASESVGESQERSSDSNRSVFKPKKPRSPGSSSSMFR